MTSDTSSKKQWILVTNDDGRDSPTLIPLVRALSAMAPVRAVVPNEERSWTSKMLSRSGTLEAKQVEIDRIPIWTVSGGYPADCANIAIHNLFDSCPMLAVSGINMGTNAGVAYFVSSGTVGAAAECALSGVPAAAFSLGLDSDEYGRWRRRDPLSPTFSDRIASAVEVTLEIGEELLRSGLPPDVSFLNVNMPRDIGPRCRRRVTGLEACTYGPFFEAAEATHKFRHGPMRLERTESSDGDLTALERNEVSITPIRLKQDVALEPSEASRFERSSLDS